MPPNDPSAVNPKDNPDLGQEPDQLPEAEPTTLLPDEDLWERYNKRMEFPLASVGTVFLHLLVGVTLVFGVFKLMGGDEDRSIPQQLVTVTGNDDSGEGSMGGGGESAELTVTAGPFTGGLEGPVDPNSLPDAKDKTPDAKLPPIDGKLPLPAPSAGTAGKGRPAPKGEGYGGTGPGGTGADSTAARGHRWVLRFRVADARDYLAQLKALGAEITFPLPPGEREHILIRDLNSPDQKKTIVGDFRELKFKDGDDPEVRRLKTMMSFYDSRPTEVRELVAVLGVNASSPPRVFRAHFPKTLEEEMSRQERSYRNRVPENIKRTYFRVSQRGGKYEIAVDEQEPYK